MRSEHCKSKPSAEQVGIGSERNVDVYFRDARHAHRDSAPQRLRKRAEISWLRAQDVAVRYRLVACPEAVRDNGDTVPAPYPDLAFEKGGIEYSGERGDERIILHILCKCLKYESGNVCFKEIRAPAEKDVALVREPVACGEITEVDDADVADIGRENESLAALVLNKVAAVQYFRILG